MYKEQTQGTGVRVQPLMAGAVGEWRHHGAGQGGLPGRGRSQPLVPRGSDSSWSLGDGGPEASFQGRAASRPPSPPYKELKEGVSCRGCPEGGSPLQG